MCRFAVHMASGFHTNTCIGQFGLFCVDTDLENDFKLLNEFLAIILNKSFNHSMLSIAIETLITSNSLNE